MWWVVVRETGASVSNLAEFKGFGSYEIAWAWSQKLRRVMAELHRDKLTGIVEVDETYIGGKETGSYR